MGDCGVFLILVTALLAQGVCACFKEDWWSSMSQEGISRCSNQSVIRGFYRAHKQRNDYITLLEGAECCNVTLPWTSSPTRTVLADWYFSLDENFKWSYCPTGYFLTGLYRARGTEGWLYVIDDGFCIKPGDHPTNYGHCYTHDISSCFNDINHCGCNESYYVTGLFRGEGGALNNIDALRCCKMASAPEPLEDISKVKTSIMEMTLTRMVFLAHYLGFMWTFGCRSQSVGDDFYRDGDTWRADQKRRCVGHRNNERLSVSYMDWSFEVKEIKFGDPVTEDLLPETIDSGIIYNDHLTEAAKTVTRSVTSVTSVSHVTSRNWTMSHEFSFSVPISWASTKYVFRYENYETTTDYTGQEHSKTIEISTTKTLVKNSTASWRIQMFKTRQTTPYTATIRAKLSILLQGFLRPGGGYYGNDPNFHIDYRGKESPNMNIRFGDAKTPFYKDLKFQSDINSLPWMWDEVKSMHSNAQNLINELCDEKTYEFTLTGSFGVVEGGRIKVHWDDSKSVNDQNRRVEVQMEDSKQAIRSTHLQKPDTENIGEVRHLKLIARAGPDDVLPPRPSPPPYVKAGAKNSFLLSPSRFIPQ